MSPFITVALQKGVSAYVGEGGGRWCGDHRDDAAKLYQLAVEKAKPGSIFHAVAEEGVSVKEIVTKVGNQLNIPVVSIQPEHAQDHFGGLYFSARLTMQPQASRRGSGWGGLLWPRD
ncbi:uncharacterized protein ATNIH1004_005287 [Aspergillus tanneri]|uniref:NmrA-like domain-containing protein n=1 Tax=Aspergillus tanneri TaxID=1220188 RepID=A0A5M9MTV3_9EURO|nr:uncharacterized protein ATNIH1004_005287 [Aspergillus tanneri]KAA8649386.1 hypothetical protein ATNIH1004_005287 [Aspergillus tanneri]